MDKIVHGILIDPATKNVSAVRINPDDPLKSAYEHIGCDLIEPAKRLPNGDVLFVDEEGLINGRTVGAFMFAGQVFKGKGLLVNESTDDWTAPHSPIIEILRMIEFTPDETQPSFTTADILAWMIGGKFRVMTKNDFDAFADALPGSLICWDMSGWTVLVCPGDSERDGPISVHAYKFSGTEHPSHDLAYMLTREGWEEF